MKILLLGKKEFSRAIANDLLKKGHEIIDLNIHQDTFLEDFETLNDVEYYNIMTKRYNLLNISAMESDAVLVINGSDGVDGTQYAALIKSNLYLKDIYFYNNTDKKYDFSFQNINRNIELIGQYNNIQNKILNLLKSSKLDANDIKEQLMINNEICQFELERLLLKGAICKGDNSYFIPNKDKMYIKRNESQFNKKY